MISKALDAISTRLSHKWMNVRYLGPAKRQFADFRPHAKNTIPVFAFDRGGSTWFTDLLLRIPGTAKIDDPTYMGYYQTNNAMPASWEPKLHRLNDLGFYFYQPIPEDAEWEEARQFFIDLFQRQIWHPLIVQETDLQALKAADRFVYKINNGHLFLPWLCQQLEMTPVLFLRHPCAVVASQLKFFVFRKVLDDPMFRVPSSFRYHEFYQPYSEILTSVKTPEEALAAQWCINFLHTAHHSQNDRWWVTMTYERLLLDKEAEMGRLFAALSLEAPADFFDGFFKPVNTDKSSAAHYRDPQQQLSQWKETLSAEQIKNILQVVKAFGITAYGESIEPDYSQLYTG